MKTTRIGARWADGPAFNAANRATRQIKSLGLAAYNAANEVARAPITPQEADPLFRCHDPFGPLQAFLGPSGGREPAAQTEAGPFLPESRAVVTFWGAFCPATVIFPDSATVIIPHCSE